jgi:hypothetical protein
MLLVPWCLIVPVLAQQARTPRFEDYPVTETFKSTPALPEIVTPEERLYRTMIRQGVSKGWGVEDGITGKEMKGPGPSFAGHYIIVTWGCGSPCLMAAIVDLKTGRIFPPPFHHGPGHSYFQVPWLPTSKALDYRLNSRLLIANICEITKESRSGGRLSYQSDKCGPHYFVMGEDGLKLIHRTLEK